MKDKIYKGLIICTFLILGVLGCGKDNTTYKDTTSGLEESEVGTSGFGETGTYDSVAENASIIDSTSNTSTESNSSTEASSKTNTSTTASSTDIAGSFYAIEIPDDIFAKMQGKSYKEDCVVPRQDLRYVHVLHKNLEGETLEGELICHKIIADDLVSIFRELYDQSYPIEKIRLIDEYDADDEASMKDNNSSCFNYRTMTGSDKISKHGLGIAVDINTLYNPYIKGTGADIIVEPSAGAEYADRESDYPYKIEEGDLCYELFIEHGFEWGGSWNSVKDYQHFELSDEKAEELQKLFL